MDKHHAHAPSPQPPTSSSSTPSASSESSSADKPCGCQEARAYDAEGRAFDIAGNQQLYTRADVVWAREDSRIAGERNGYVEGRRKGLELGLTIGGFVLTIAAVLVRRL